MEAQTKNVLKVEFIQVEMANTNSCSACDTVQSKLIVAIQQVQKLFDNLNCDILFKSTTIKTIEEAEKVQIVASPTIRIGNFEFYPAHSANNAEKREWTWNGVNMPEPNKKTLIEVLLKGYFEPEEEKEKRNISPYIREHLNKIESAERNCGCS